MVLQYLRGRAILLIISVIALLPLLPAQSANCFSSSEILFITDIANKLNVSESELIDVFEKSCVNSLKLENKTELLNNSISNINSDISDLNESVNNSINDLKSELNENISDLDNSTFSKNQISDQLDIIRSNISTLSQTLPLEAENKILRTINKKIDSQIKNETEDLEKNVGNKLSDLNKKVNDVESNSLKQSDISEVLRNFNNTQQTTPWTTILIGGAGLIILGTVGYYKFNNDNNNGKLSNAAHDLYNKRINKERTTDYSSMAKKKRGEIQNKTKKLQELKVHVAKKIGKKEFGDYMKPIRHKLIDKIQNGEISNEEDLTKQIKYYQELKDNEALDTEFPEV